MGRFNAVLAHLTAALALAIAVVLVIDMFFNSAMGFAASREFKYMCLALCACNIVTARRH